MMDRERENLIRRMNEKKENNANLKRNSTSNNYSKTSDQAERIKLHQTMRKPCASSRRRFAAE
jgi:hypothetical protein